MATIKPQPEDCEPWAECPNPGEWTHWASTGVECEVARFLTALVIMLRPRVIVETGTHMGFSACALADGCRLAGVGHLWTLETVPDLVVNARQNLDLAGLSEYATVVQGGDVLDDVIVKYDLGGKVDLYFGDAGLPSPMRVGELMTALPQMSLRGVAVVHDTSDFWDCHNGGMQTHINRLGLDQVRLPTPRGLTIVRRKGEQRTT